ncbi:MAG: hypothetical protein ACYC2G_05300 [Gemmatimonadaceae bacterium]
MFLRSLLVILALSVPLSPSVAAAGAAVPAPTEQLEQEGPSIGSDRQPMSGDFRVSEGVEPLTAVGRVLADGAHAMRALVQRGAGACAARESLADGWCDVVQCRRQSGARLLRYATAPPRR